MKNVPTRSACRLSGNAIHQAMALSIVYALLILPVAAVARATDVKTGNIDRTVVKRAKRVAPLPRTKGVPGPDLPDLASVRNLQPAEPHAAAPVEAGQPCYDCGGHNQTADFAAARTEPRNRTGAGFDLL